MSDDVKWSLPVLMTFMRFVWFVIVLAECDREAGQWFKSNSFLILFTVLCLVAALRSHIMYDEKFAQHTNLQYYILIV